MGKAFVFVLVGIISSCSCLDLESSREGKCMDPPPKTVPFNPAKFMDKSITLYTPLLSKYDLYRQIEDVAGERKFKGMKEEDIDKSCLTFSGEDEMTFRVRLFDRIEKDFVFGAGTTATSLSWKAKGLKDWQGESWVTKTTDDYFLTVNCWANGERSFAVNAVKSKLGSKEMEDIYAHLKSLGFKSEYFYEFNYELCPQSNRRKEL